MRTTLVSSRAFSLVEILIALGIIALFVTLPVLAYSNYSKQSRDEKRKSDIVKISQSLEQYKAQKGVYPRTGDLDALVRDGFLLEIPVDPKNGQEVAGETGLTYGYEYTSDSFDYSLQARLEGDVYYSASGGGSGGSGGSGSSKGPGVFRLTNRDPAGQTAPVVQLTEEAAANPTAIIPTETIYVSPTSGVVASITGSPCNGTIVCSGICSQLPLRCGTYASTQSSCEYTTRNGKPNCAPMPAPDQPCTITGGVCTGNGTCSGTNCLSPTPTPPNCNAGVTCTGACQVLPGRCSSYASTRSGCTYTTYSGGGSCVTAAAPNQACTASSSCTLPLVCVSTNCVTPSPTFTPSPTPYSLVFRTHQPASCLGCNDKWVKAAFNGTSIISTTDVTGTLAARGGSATCLETNLNKTRLFCTEYVNTTSTYYHSVRNPWTLAELSVYSNPPGFSFSGAASPDGTKYAAPNGNRISIFNTNGTGIQNSSNQVNGASVYAYSPSGNSVLYSTINPSTNYLDIYTLSTTTLTSTLIGSGMQYGGNYGGYSLDGRYVAYHSQQGYDTRVYIFDVQNGGPAVSVHHDPSVNGVHDITWVDNTSLIFGKYTGYSTPYDLYRVTIGGVLTRLTNTTAHEWVVGLNQTRTKILYLTDITGVFNLYQMNLDGTNQQAITTYSDRSVGTTVAY